MSKEFMSGFGTFSQCWLSCFQSPSQDDVTQQVVELSTLVGFCVRGPGMVMNDEISNLDQGDLSVIVYAPINDVYIPYNVVSVMEGVQGGLSNTLVQGLLPNSPPMDLQQLVDRGLWPLYAR